MGRSGPIVLAAAFVVGCYEPPRGTCTIECTVGATDACPSGMTCTAGFCVEPGRTCTTDLAAIAVGGRHVCGLDPDGRAICWGDNHQGQVGVPSISTIAKVPFYV